MILTELEENLIKNKMVVTQVSGKSMQPFLNNGDKVVISYTNNFKILDICLAKTGKKYILHRLIKINGDEYVLKGDNNYKVEKVKKLNILGVLSGYYKNDKFIELNDEINNKYYRYSKFKKPLLYLKSLLKYKFRYYVINVAGLNIKIHSKNSYVFDNFEDYITDSRKNIDIDIINSKSEIESVSEVSNLGLKEFILIHEKIANQLYRFNRILIHGAAIAYNNQAYLFSGDSGIGKSTHIKYLKNLYNDITIINGDKPIIDDKGIVYGTPWSGKEKWNTNTSFPLKSIIFVNRDTYNHIEKLDKNECLERLLNNVYKENGLNEIINILDKALNNVTFYNLYCTDDPESAKLTFETIINK